MHAAPLTNACPAARDSGFGLMGVKLLASRLSCDLPSRSSKLQHFLKNANAANRQKGFGAGAGELRGAPRGCFRTLSVRGIAAVGLWESSLVLADFPATQRPPLSLIELCTCRKGAWGPSRDSPEDHEFPEDFHLGSLGSSSWLKRCRYIIGHVLFLLVVKFQNESSRAHYIRNRERVYH